MSKSLVIAGREFHATVGSKSFVIGLAIMPVIIVGSIALQHYARDRIDVSDKRIVIADATGKLWEPLRQAAEAHNTAQETVPEGEPRESRYLLELASTGTLDDETRLKLSDQVRAGELYAFVELPAELLDSPTAATLPPAPRFYSLSRITSPPRRWLEQRISGALRTQRFQAAGLDPDVVARLNMPVRFETLEPFERSASGELREPERQDRETALFVPMGAMMLMVISIFMTAQGLVQSVVEEKQLRIAEVLMGSVNPTQLMAGKLLGNVGASLVMVTVYLSGGIGLAWYYESLDIVPLHLLGWFFVYQVLAVLLFGSIFVAIGAACSNMSETQNLMLPVMLLAMLPMFIWFNVLQDPLSQFAVAASLFPTATPFLMILRQAASPAIPLWQPLLGISLVLVATAVVVFLAGRVFRVGILSQGKAPSLAELATWMARG